MLRKGFIAAFIIFLSATIGTASADNAKDREIVNKVLANVMMIKGKTSIGKVTRSGDTISAHDVVYTFPNMTAKYTQVDIKNYRGSSFWSSEYKIDQLLIKDIVVKATGPGAPPIEVTFAEFSYSGIRGSEKKHYIKIKSGKGKGLKLNPAIPGAPDFSQVTFEADGLEINQLDKLAKAVDAMQNFVPNPSNPFPKEIKDYVLLIYKNMSFDRMVIKGMPAFPGPRGETFRIGEFFVGNVKNGLFGEISLKDMAFKAPSDPRFQSAQIGYITLKEFDAVNLIENALLLRGGPPNPEQALKLLQALKGIEVKFEMQGREFNFGVEGGINWGDFVGLFPTKYTEKGKLYFSLPNTPQAAASPASIFFKKAGLDKLSLRINNQIKWDGKSRIVLDPVSYDLDKLVSVKLTASIGNVTKDLFLEKDLRVLGPKLLGTNIGPITLEITDKGAQKLMDQQAKAMWGAMSGQLLANPQLAPIVQDINKLINEPGGKLKITLTPKSPMNFAQLSIGAVAGPQALLPLFDIKSTYSK